MSFFDKVLGKKSPKKAPAPTLPKAIQNLSQTEELLTKKQNYLENKIKKEIAIAKQNARTNKKAALHALQRKKRYEKQLQQIDGTLTTLEGQRDALENANMNTLAVSTMKNAKDALKAAHKQMDVDQVEKLLDDLADHKEIAEEITDAISHPVAFNEDFDDEELEKELQELSLDELSIDDKLPQVPADTIAEQTLKIKQKREALAADT